VPGLTDDNYNINKINKLLKTLVYMDKFEILPYHKNGIAKYKNLGIKYELSANEPTEKEMETLKQKLFK
jgi:pyruvate formate lyase activating enzyme